MPVARRWRRAAVEQIIADQTTGKRAIMDWDLPLIWAGVLAVAVAMYVILGRTVLGRQ